MRPIGNLEVLTNFLRGEGGTIIMSGGANRVIRAVAVAQTFQEVGITRCTGVGFSGGALVLAGLYSGKAHKGREVILQLAQGGFLRKRRFPPFVVKNVDVPLLMDTITPLLDEPRIESHPHELLFGVTNFHTGEGRLINAKSQVVRALRATSAIPGLCEPERLFEEDVGEYLGVDGMCSMSFVDAIKKVRPKNVVLICNSLLPQDTGRVEEWLFYLLTQYLFWHLPLPLRKAALRFDNDLDRNLACIQRRKQNVIKWLILCPDPSEPQIWPWTTDVSRLNSVFARWHDDVSRLVEQAYPCSEV